MEAELQEISELVAAGERRLAIRSGELQSVTPDELWHHDIQWDLRLAARALLLLRERLREHRDASRVPVDEGAVEQERLAAFDRLHSAALDAELLIRQVYELLYAIQVLVRRLDDKTLVPSPSELEELERLCLFRESVLVPKENAVRPGRGGRMWDASGMTVRFSIALQSVGEQDAIQLESVFARTRPFLPDDKKAEEDWNERLQLLYDHWPVVPDSDRGAVAALIRTNGVRSDPPVVLARMVRALVRRFFPPQEWARSR